jgi:hypothetical protein
MTEPTLPRRSTTVSSAASSATSLSLSDASRSKPRRVDQTHEEIFHQHNTQIQQIFDNRHHDINFDDDGTASWDEDSFGNSSLSSLDDASLSELRSALIARRQRILDEGSVGRRRGRSLDRSLGSLSFASWTGSLTSLTRRKKKKKKEKDKDKKKKKKKKKHKEGEEEKKSKKKKSKDDGDKKKSKEKQRKDDDDETSLKKKNRAQKQHNDSAMDKSGRSWDPDRSSKKKNLFNLSGLNMSQSGNDSNTFVFYACDENTGCCAL